MAGARRVLDLGCGTGFPLVELAERLGRGAFVAGLDPWAAALRRARAKIVRWSAPAAAVRGSGAVMPFRSGAFDLVVSNLGVNNFDDAPAALRECCRVLRPGGILGLSSNLVGHMREYYAACERVLAAAGDREASARLLRHVEHRAMVSSLCAILEHAGFRVTSLHERETVLRFGAADALFSHRFIRLGFRSAWEEIVFPAALVSVRAELDRVAA